MAPVPSAPATPVGGAPGNQPPTDAAASPSAAPASSGPQAATPADALGAVRLEIAAARAAGIIDQRTAVKLARELDKLVADGKSLPRRVENVRRDLTRSLARSDVPQPLVNRLDGLLRQVGGGFTVTPPMS